MGYWELSQDFYLWAGPQKVRPGFVSLSLGADPSPTCSLSLGIQNLMKELELELHGRAFA
jgi:hypothetical protein